MNYVGRDPSPGSFVFPTPPSQPGRLVQSAAHVRVDYLSQGGVPLIPLDDTIPQIAEGFEFLTLNFAPLFIGSRLRISVQFNGSHNTANQDAIFALFRAPGPDALAACPVGIATIDTEYVMTFDYELIAASLAVATYSLRANVTGGQLRMNGRAARLLGGSERTFLRIDEYCP